VAYKLGGAETWDQQATSSCDCGYQRASFEARVVQKGTSTRAIAGSFSWMAEKLNAPPETIAHRQRASCQDRATSTCSVRSSAKRKPKSRPNSANRTEASPVRLRHFPLGERRLILADINGRYSKTV